MLRTNTLINSTWRGIVLIVVCTLSSLSVFAQTSAFTYQGKLTDGGAPAVGTYQMQFSLFKVEEGGDPLGPAIQIDSVDVRNGVFTVELNFTTPNAFNGGARWLEIAVKKPTDHLPSLLTPRQPITSTPYALRTLVANSADTLSSACTLCVTDANIQTLDGSKVTGTVPNAVNAINVTGVVLGAIKWEVVSGQSQQAQANTGYLTTNEGQTTITLPTSPKVGDIVRISGSGAGGWRLVQNDGQFVVGGANLNSPAADWTPHLPTGPWQAIASSADGMKLVVCGVDGGTGTSKIYTSTDFGVTWTQKAISLSVHWRALASSADGAKLIAGTNEGIYTSNNFGESWTNSVLPSGNWRSVASSSDGVKLAAVIFGSDSVFTSDDSGITWHQHIITTAMRSVASSALGDKLVAINGNGFIYTSTDYGANWIQRDTIRTWQSVASSADGNKLVALESSGLIYTSSNSGATWTPRETSHSWRSVASSADGSKLVATVLNGQIYVSTDSGMTWAPRAFTTQWEAVGSSADGNRLVAVVNPGQIYTSSQNTTLGTEGYLTGGQFTSLELQYVGNGKFFPLSHEGAILGH